MLIPLLVFLFFLGCVVGSLLNVCIYRIPLEKSILWPGSRCGHCWQPIRWYDNIPVLSYFLLWGRCRTCGRRFSPRYLIVELLTGACFSLLFYLVVYANVHQFRALQHQHIHIDNFWFPSWTAWIIWGHHCLLTCYLIVASFCDLDHREIPLSITVPGTMLGLALATIFAWPWPESPAQANPANPLAWQDPNQGPGSGLYPLPFWGPLPAWFHPGDNWQTGLATGFLGALVGTLMLRIIRFLFSMGLGIEALGLGDADLMMMAGSFLGWQPVVAAFFVGVFVGLIFGIVQMIVHGDNMMPFGPALAIGTLLTCLAWAWIGPPLLPLLFNGWLLALLAGASCILMLAASYILRLMRM